MTSPSNVISLARSVMDLESKSIKAAANKLSSSFLQAVDMIADCKGRIVVSGMGKSGLVGRKIAATLASLGTPSLFLHPAEALHGDLGMIKDNDIVLMLSNGGETEELIRVLSHLNHFNVLSILISGNSSSTLATYCGIFIDGSVSKEACQHNLAPTCSTAVAMAIGDAIAISVSSLNGFAATDFARFHPGGSIGKKLLCKVADVMTTKSLPCCTPASTLREIIPVMTSGKLGVAFVLQENRLIGIITDGDLRRAITSSIDLDISAASFMTCDPHITTPEAKIYDASSLMQHFKISILPVVSGDELVGAIQLADCAYT